MLKKNGTLSALQLASMLETTERTIQRYLKQLKDSNKITRIGGAKGGYWKVMQQWQDETGTGTGAELV